MVEFTEVSRKNLKVTFEVVIPGDVLSETFKEELAEKQKNSKFPGFRPGKAPMWVVTNDERKLLEGGDLKDSLFGKVVIKHAYAYCDEIKKNLDLVIFNGQEKLVEIDIDAYKEGVADSGRFKDIKFLFECELQPQVPEVNFEEIEVNKRVFEVTDDDINKEIERLKADSSTYEDAPDDYIVKEKDRVICDLEGKIDGKDFSGNKANDLRIEVGRGELLEGLEGAMVGMEAGEEKYADITFPDDYSDETVRGENAEYLIRINSIEKAKKIETEEDLIKHHSLKDKEDLIRFVREGLTGKCNEIVEIDIREQILEAIEKYDNFEVPESIIENQRAVLKRNAPHLSGEELEKEVMSSSRSAIVLGDFAIKRGIKITNEDIANHMRKVLNVDPSYFSYMVGLYRESKEFAHSVNLRIIEEKVFNEIMNAVKKKEVISTVDEILEREEKLAATIEKLNEGVNE